jgi:cysteine desulfurase/selenocysteine lyase
MCSCALIPLSHLLTFSLPTLMTQAAPNWAKLRSDFPILDQKVHGKLLIYFDKATNMRQPW